MALGPTSATVSNVSAVASSAATLFAEALGSVDARYVFNDSTALLYLKYGSGASASSHTAQVKPGGFWEAPSPPFRGQITGLWAAATGTARCTEA